MNPIGGITLLASLWHELEVARADNAKLREQIERLQPKDCEGNALDIADTVSMLRSEYDGDHEWDDVVVELALTKWGGDRWIVRGSKGEAWACDCHKTGYDEDAYEGSDDAEPIVNPSLIEVENAKLRWQMKKLVTMLRAAWDIDASWDGLRRFWNIELTNDGCLMRDRACKAEAENAKLRELGGEVASILFNLDVDRCGRCQRDDISHPCPVHTVKGGECLIKSELRELGVEVQERYDMRDEWEDAIMAENAKLRELIQDFDKCLTEAVRLAYIQGYATIYDGTLLDSLHPRMRELGIEVK